jgi:two-component system, sensor histidine kinase and response regulator
MTDLGYLTVSDNQSVITARTKIFQILRKTGFSEIEASRMGSVLSELMHTESYNKEFPKITISLLKLYGQPQIRFEIALKDEKNPYNGLAFDKTDISRETDTGTRLLRYSKFIHIDTVDAALIHELQQTIAQPSRKELMEELSMSNQELTKNKLFLQSVLENIRSVVYVKDPENRYQYVNHAFEELAGMHSADIIGHTSQKVFQGKQGRLFYKNTLTVIKSRSVITEEEYCTNSKGENVIFLATRVPITADGKITGICGIATDITHLKQMERDIIKAEKTAEAASQSKSDFLANMSHEIRTPLNAVIGLSYLLQHSGLTANQLDYVKKIQLSSQHLVGLINDILDFSKIEAGKIKLETIEFRISDILDNVSNLMREQCITKGLELIFDIDTHIPEILYGDPLRLGQILINYTSNAVKFTEKGEIIIRIRRVSRTGDECLLHFEVQDTGIGIKDDQKEKLFQMFHQADTSTTRKYGGTGLGLAISKQLAALMGGSVGVTSVYGRGSTFWFTALLKAGQEEKKTNTCPKINGMKALVVEDNPQTAMILSNMLTAMSINADTAEDGYKAIEKIQAAEKTHTPYRIIYMDMQMTGVNGAETYKKIKTLGLSELPRCIMITAFGREEVFREAETAGIAVVLIKPVNPSMVYDATVQTLYGSTNRKRIPVAAGTPSVMLAAIRGTKILLVEDNELNQQIVAELLKEGGVTIDIAGDGQAALEKIAGNTYDIVLMDIQMPVMDGLEATRKIRKDNKFSKLPIIAMTASAMKSDIDQCFSAGMSDYIAKPINPELMFKTLLKWVPAKDDSAPPAGGSV